MWNLRHSITSIALLNRKPLIRWLVSIVIFLPKDEGRPQIHRLRIINIFESEYNLVLKYFWPKQGMKKAEANHWLGNNQTGGNKLLRSWNSNNWSTHNRNPPTNQVPFVYPPRWCNGMLWQEHQKPYNTKHPQVWYPRQHM